MNNVLKKLFKQNKKDLTIGKRRRDENREIGVLTYAFLAIFILLIVYLGLFTQFQGHDVVNNTYNKRQSLLEERLVRGDIKSRNGDLLATTIGNRENEQRVYPYNEAFAHVVGYSTHGVLGIEKIVNFKLLESDDNVIRKVSNDLKDIKNKGNTVNTTLDTEMQLAAWESMGSNKGAVMAMNARTGEILAMVSKPDFNPNNINEDWDMLNSEKLDSPLLNRAVLGSYAPGSTFKIVTALEYLKENERSYKDYSYDCYGSFSYKGTTINCYHGQNHGELDFHLSFAKSCNSSFANITSTLDKAEFEETCKELLFDSELPLPFSYSESHTTIDENSSTDELLQTGIGQGKTIVTPAHVTLITSAIANGGVLMQPYIISSVESINGRVIERTKPREYGRLLDSEDADVLGSFMRDVVTDGTARSIKNTNGYDAYGKTGSAEYSLDKTQSHAWFTGYGKNEEDVIVVTVIVECGGSGGEVAAPIAKSVFDAYFN